MPSWNTIWSFVKQYVTHGMVWFVLIALAFLSLLASYKILSDQGYLKVSDIFCVGRCFDWFPGPFPVTRDGMKLVGGGLISTDGKTLSDFGGMQFDPKRSAVGKYDITFLKSLDAEPFIIVGLHDPSPIKGVGISQIGKTRFSVEAKQLGMSSINSQVIDGDVSFWFLIFERPKAR